MGRVSDLLPEEEAETCRSNGEPPPKSDGEAPGARSFVPGLVIFFAADPGSYEGGDEGTHESSFQQERVAHVCCLMQSIQKAGPKAITFRTKSSTMRSHRSHKRPWNNHPALSRSPQHRADRLLVNGTDVRRTYQTGSC